MTLRSAAAAQRFPTTYRLVDDVEIAMLPDPEWLVDGICPRRGKVVIYAPPSTFKTTLASLLAVAIARGQDWFGHRVVHRGDVLYLGEDIAGWKIRLLTSKRTAGIAADTPIGVYTFPELIDLADPGSVDRFAEFIGCTGGVFVACIYDTFSILTPGAAENSSEDMTIAMRGIERLAAAFNCVQIILHHTNAGGTRERGHSALRGAADAMIALTPVDDAIHVECSKMRNGPPFETFTLKPELVAGGGITLKLASEVLPSSHLTAQQMKVLNALKDIGGQDGVPKAAWRTACPDVTERTFYKVANTLESHGLVVKIGNRFRLGGSR